MLRKLLFLLIIVACFLKAPGQQKRYFDTTEIDLYLQTEMRKWNVPGCAIAIVMGDKLIYTKGYGWRDIENKLPVTSNTVFKIASCTKSFTAAAAGMLVDQKILDWNKPVKDYLPELEFINNDLTRQVSLKDLLTHRTGLYDDDWSWVGEHIDAKRLFEIISAMPQQKPFRTSYIYSNMMYALAGELISQQSHLTWRQLIRKKFFEPLSMQESSFSHTENSGLKDFAFGYENNDSTNYLSRGNLAEHHTDSLSVCEAFAFISSSALDLSKWITLFMNGGNFHGNNIIPEKVFKELITPVNYVGKSEFPEVSESYYCLGWIMNYYKGHQLFHHSGGLSGFKSYMSFMPKDSIGIVILSNGQPYRFPEAITYDLYDLLLNLDKKLWSNLYFQKQKSNAGTVKKLSKNIPGTNPSMPLVEYTGTYFSKWLGKMNVYFENGDLLFQFHQYPKEKMKHAHYNTFFTEQYRSPGTGITFQIDHNGKISGLMLNEFLFEKVY